MNTMIARSKTAPSKHLPRTLAAIGASTLLAACGSVPKKTFTFDAVTLSNRPHPCMIVVDGRWTEAAENKQFVNVDGDDELSLTLEFQNAEVEITVAPLQPGTTAYPRTRSEAIRNSDFIDDDPRRLRTTDPQKHLFVLQPK